jgi:hypothetical protein
MIVKNNKTQQPIPLYTTASTQPWYHTLHPVSLSLKPRHHPGGTGGSSSASSGGNDAFRYRYAIHRAGAFYRMEQPSDAPAEISTAVDDDNDGKNKSISGGESTTTEGEAGAGVHVVPLRLLSNRESYVVNDVLGKTTGPPDIDHIRVGDQRYNALNKQIKKSLSASQLHSRNSSFAGAIPTAAATTTNTTGGGDGAPGATTSASSARKKAVGFAPVPPPYHRPKASASLQSVHLNSTDGLVVVSAFLPVVLHRSEVGTWTADWDYEALLSMQTHLRVTRIGVVKWRGWHGNFGASAINARANKESSSHSSSSGSSVDGGRGGGNTLPPLSSAAGVPINERHLVEECLRPFNCVPVWIDPVVFGEM